LAKNANQKGLLLQIIAVIIKILAFFANANLLIRVLYYKMKNIPTKSCSPAIINFNPAFPQSRFICAQI
jgi:hypothetical protein